jgi:hypothetical protein
MCYGVLATADLASKGFWSGYAFDETCTDHINEFMYFPDFALTSDVSVGGEAYSYPVVGDINNDGIKEIIVANDNVLYAYYVNPSGVLTLLDSITTLGLFHLPSISEPFNGGQMAIINSSCTVCTDVNVSTPRVVGVWGDYILSYTFNSTRWRLQSQLNFTTQNVTHEQNSDFNGIYCTSLRSGFYDQCFFISRNKRLVKWDSGTNVLSSIAVHTGFGATGVCSNIAIEDIDRDGVNEGVFSCTSYLMSYDLNSFVKEFTTNVGYSGKRILIYNADGGDSEIYVHVGDANNWGIRNYNSLGALMSGTNQATTGVSSMDGLMQGFFTLTTHEQICLIESRSVAQTLLMCLDANNGSSLFTPKTFVGNYALSHTDGAVAVDANADGFDDIVTPKFIYDVYHDEFINLTRKGYVGKIVVTDVTQDGQADIIGTSSILGKTYYMSSISTVPSSHPITKSGLDLYRNFENPVCVGSNVVWTAYDCLDYEAGKCHYTNSYPAFDEYLYTDCGTGSTFLYTAGLPVSSSPIVSCVFNHSGVYQVKIYLTDTGIWTQPTVNPFWTQTIYVQNATGFNCNLFPYIPGPGIVLPNASQVNDVQNVVTGGGSWSLTIAAFIILLLLTFGSIYMLWINYGIHDPQIVGYATAFVVLVGWIFLCIYEIIGWWTLIVAILISAAIVSLKLLQQASPVGK